MIEDENEKVVFEITKAIVKKSKNKKASWTDITEIAHEKGIDYDESTKILEKLQEDGYLLNVSEAPVYALTEHGQQSNSNKKQVEMKKILNKKIIVLKTLRKY